MRPCQIRLSKKISSKFYYQCFERNKHMKYKVQVQKSKNYSNRRVIIVRAHSCHYLLSSWLHSYLYKAIRNWLPKKTPQPSSFKISTLKRHLIYIHLRNLIMEERKKWFSQDDNSKMWDDWIIFATIWTEMFFFLFMVVDWLVGNKM